MELVSRENNLGLGKDEKDNLKGVRPNRLGILVHGGDECESACKRQYYHQRSLC